MKRRTEQPRLGHAELALREAGREARTHQEEAKGLRQVLGAVDATLVQVRPEVATSERVREGLKRHQETKSYSGLKAGNRADTAMRRRVGRPLGSTNHIRDQVLTREPAPVRW